MYSNINLHQLRVFALVAKEKSFSKGASSLRMSQPSVSIQIRNLEDTLGAKLFNRMGRAVYLTSEGQTVLAYARRIFDLIGNLQTELQDLKGLKGGKLVVGASRIAGATFLPLMIGAFKKNHSDTGISMKVARSSQVEQWVLEDEVDLAITTSDPSSPQILKEPFCEEELVLVLPPNHPLSKMSAVSPEEISKEILLLPDTGWLTRLIESVFTSQGIPIARRVVLGDMDALKSSINASLGVSIMSKSTVEREARSGYLAIRKIRNVKLRHSLNIIYHKDKRLGNLALSFLEFLRNRSKQSGASRPLTIAS